jgi:hypothetical protein
MHMAGEGVCGLCQTPGIQNYYFDIWAQYLLHKANFQQIKYIPSLQS